MTVLRKKIQASVEFMILLAVILILFLLVIYFTQDVFSNIRHNKQLISASELCENVAWTINEVYLAGDGGFATIPIPDKLQGDFNYYISVYKSNRLVEIRWEGKHYTVPILIPNISGSTSITPGQLNITNKDGGILLEQ